MIDEIRDRVDVVAVIGRHMELKRSGRTWKGCCVFHGERTPSFHVYPEDKHFKCYGCGAYGDVFAFLQKLEGKEFPEVVRDLAREVGVEIPEAGEESAEQKQRRRERAEIGAASEAATRYFSARLASRFGAPARAYLAERGIGEDAVKRFRLGVSADEWSDLGQRLEKKGVSTEALLRAGLVIERERKGGFYDRFRNRLMFPIAAMDGQVIGFGGRTLPGGAKDEKGAKYINTPETPVYKKSRVLYGLDLARETIRRTRQAVLVEGYFDVIGLSQAGVTGAVAVCGTALTPEHVELLQRLDCREVIVLFDGDAAGLAAPAKAAAALLPAGLAGKVAVLPSEGGKTDPDEFARAHGREGLEKLLAAATPLSTFLVDRAVERTCGGRPREASLEAKLAAVRELVPYVRMMPEGLPRSVFEDAIAKRLELDLAALREELAGKKSPGEKGGPPRAKPERGGGAAPKATVRARLLLPGPAADALGLLAAFPDLGPIASEEGLPGFLPPGPLADLARALIGGTATAEEALARLAEAADPAILRRVREIAGPARPARDQAERELRKATTKAAIEAVRVEQDRLLALVAKKGAPVDEELAVAAQVAARRRSDLEKRLRGMERSG